MVGRLQRGMGAQAVSMKWCRPGTGVPQLPIPRPVPSAACLAVMP